MYIDKLDSLTKEIRTIQNKYNLNNHSLEIMIVTKKQSNKVVSELMDYKHNYFGENRKADQLEMV